MLQAVWTGARTKQERVCLAFINGMDIFVYVISLIDQFFIPIQIHER